MTVAAVPFPDAFNTSYASDPTLKREDLHVIRDLGCTPASGASPVDNYSLLAPAFLQQSRIPRRLLFDGQVYAIGSTLHTTHRTGLEVCSVGGPSGAWANTNLVNSGVTPGAFEFAGVSSALVWIGTAGGTMVHLHSNDGVWRGVSLWGQYQNSDGGLLGESIVWTNGAAVAMQLGEGSGANLDTPPYYFNPGRWAFYDCNFSAVSVGFKAATAYSTDHADQCLLQNVGFTGVEDAIWIRGQQANQYTIIHPRYGLVERFMRISGGGQITVIDPWLGNSGYTNSDTSAVNPVLFHIERCDVQGGNLIVINTQVDATAAHLAKIIDHGAITQGKGYQKTAFSSGVGAEITSGASSLLRAQFYGGLNAFTGSGAAEPLFRLIGRMIVDLYGWHYLEDHIFEMAHLTGLWSDLAGTPDFTPDVNLWGCSFRKNLAASNAPGANSIYSSAGQKYFLGWTGCRWDVAGRIANNSLDTT